MTNNMNILIKLLTVLTLLSLTGCTTYYTKTIDYDQFFVEEDWHRSSHILRAHGPTGVDNERLCSKTIDFCLEGRSLNIHTRKASNLLIVTHQKSKKWYHYFLDASTGTQLKCQNCPNISLNKQGLVLHIVSTGHHYGGRSFALSKDGTKVFFSYSKDGGSGLSKYSLGQYFKQGDVFHSALAEYHPEGIIWTDIDTTNGANKGVVSRNKISPDGSKLSWFHCKPECDLVQYNITNQQYTRQPSPCTNIGNLQIIWQDNQAIGVHAKGSSMPHAKAAGGICLNKKGEYYFPLSKLQFY